MKEKTILVTVLGEWMVGWENRAKRQRGLCGPGKMVASPSVKAMGNKRGGPFEIDFGGIT